MACNLCENKLFAELFPHREMLLLCCSYSLGREWNGNHALNRTSATHERYRITASRVICSDRRIFIKSHARNFRGGKNSIQNFFFQDETE